jgi:uncharacterized Zn-binding protein involved in type VI secretion
MKYNLATLGSKTERGGEVVTATTIATSYDLAVAAVGDLVRYPNGDEAYITSGAGARLNFDGKVVALVGSHISNGDKIISCPVETPVLDEPDDNPIVGFLDEGYSHAQV